ncbi:zinc-binding dehydrogenase [Pseudonocardia halophobica]|uniref:zinc-binding dehydrogenase n=1 Tax=Pseudonocardia halophobica TaxID=29401 RepID=UPI003D89D0EF
MVQGSGPLGLFAVAKAVTMGPRRVIVVGAPADRLALARRWGAAEAIDITEVPDAADRTECVMGLTGGLGADVVVEMSGAPAAFTEGMAMLRRGGRYLLVGQISPAQVTFNPALAVMKQASIVGVFSGAIEHYARALQFMEAHHERFDWTEMITSSRPLTEINDAMDAMRGHREIKPALTMVE